MATSSEDQKTSQSVQDEAPAWQTYLEIVEIEHKGRGYRARCNIPAMTCIMHDIPLISPPFPKAHFRTHRSQHPPHIMKSFILQVLENQEYFDMLSPQVASGQFSQEVSPDPSRYSNEIWQLAHEKISTNIFSGESPDSNVFHCKEILKVGVKTSLFNHSCYPNAVVTKIPKTNNQQVETIRDIIQGEEVCITYLPDSYLPREERQRMLLDRGFECCCERCSTESVFERDIPLTANVNLVPLSNETIAPLRQLYDQLVHEFKFMFGLTTSESRLAWVTRAEQWLIDAWKTPYQLHQFHWLSVHLYKLLRDRYKTMYLRDPGDRTQLRKKVLFYGKLIIRAEFAVLQPLDPHKQAVDAFLDDWNDMGMPRNGAWKLLKELEPNAEIIIKKLNE